MIFGVLCFHGFAIFRHFACLVPHDVGRVNRSAATKHSDRPSLERRYFRVLRPDGAFPCRGATFLSPAEQESQKRCQATALKRNSFRVLRLDGAFPRRGATFLSPVERESQKRCRATALERKNFRVLRPGGAFPCRGATFLSHV